MTRSIVVKTALGVVASLALAGAADAQNYAGAITVYGAPSVDGDHPALAQHVTYRDLNLRTAAGVKALQWRVARAADRLCARLGEPPAIEQNTAVLPSCQAAARDSASLQISRAVTRARAYRVRYYRHGSSAPAYSRP